MADSKNSARISMVIRVLVILGIAFFAADEFYFKNQIPEPTAEEIQAKLAKTKKNKKNREKEAKDAQDKAEKVAGAGDAPLATEPPAEPPIENINIIEKSEQVQPESLDQKIDKISENIPAETSEIKDEIKPEMSKLEVKTEPSIEAKIETKEEVSKNTSTNLDSNSIEDIKIPSQNKSSENSMASKIVETLIETPPPAYDQIGRGLVYNCKDKYWACVDKSAYVTCNKNLKYNESVGKSKECVTQSIYATDEDCAKIQKYNVSVSQSTDFCKN